MQIIWCNPAGGRKKQGLGPLAIRYAAVLTKGLQENFPYQQGG